jgi:hypothetical protein
MERQGAKVGTGRGPVGFWGEENVVVAGEVPGKHPVLLRQTNEVVFAACSLIWAAGNEKLLPFPRRPPVAESTFKVIKSRTSCSNAAVV